MQSINVSNNIYMLSKYTTTTCTIKSYMCPQNQLTGLDLIGSSCWNCDNRTGRRRTRQTCTTAWAIWPTTPWTSAVSQLQVWLGCCKKLQHHDSWWFMMSICSWNGCSLNVIFFQWVALIVMNHMMNDETDHCCSKRLLSFLVLVGFSRQ